MFSSYTRNLALIASVPCMHLAQGAENQLQSLTHFGPNPTNVSMYIYLPSKLAANPPIIVNPHWCSGTASEAFRTSYMATLADQYGYIMLFPDSPRLADRCWDVSSKQTLTHNGGGDSLGIVSAVRYILDKYNGDPSRVFAHGISSGGMMTNVLLGAYPDLFAAGSAVASVPFGCFAGDGFGVWNSECSSGQTIKTGAEWAAIVEAAYSGYKGYRPKIQLFHGDNDTTVNPQNFKEAIKQWSTVLGVDNLPVNKIVGVPTAGWTKYAYGNQVEAYLAAGAGHGIQIDINLVIAWFDLKCTGGGCFSRLKTYA